MSFLWTTIKVKSMEESLKFYEEVVGLKISERFPAGPDTEIYFLGNGETKVELICDKNYQDIQIGSDISLGFKVESLDETMEMVKGKSIEITAGPISPSPDVKFFFIEDPNGLRIQFVESK